VTKEQVLMWLKALDDAHLEAINIALCASWALDALHSMRDQVFQDGKVYSFKTGQQLSGARPIKPWPDQTKPMRNFEMIGRALDYHFHQINILLPEGAKNDS
jgi:hypothetical protein